MCPLQYLESNRISFPEIDSPASLSAIAGLCVSVAAILMFRIFCSTKRRGIKADLMLCSTLAAVTLGAYFAGSFSLSNLAAGILGILAAFESLMLIWSTVRSKQNPRRRAVQVGSICLLALILIVAFWNYNVSFVYYLPASYPPPVRDQLRMVARIISVENGTSNTVTGKLSGIHLVKNGTELIPDSIRSDSEYQGYHYDLRADNSEKDRFMVDASPLDYDGDELSLHGYGYFDSDYDNEFSECITMAHNRGGVASDSDRHFHRRNLLSLWFDP